MPKKGQAEKASKHAAATAKATAPAAAPEVDSKRSADAGKMKGGAAKGKGKR